MYRHLHDTALRKGGVEEESRDIEREESKDERRDAGEARQRLMKALSSTRTGKALPRPVGERNSSAREEGPVQAALHIIRRSPAGPPIYSALSSAGLLSLSTED